jgi:tRNA1(Val) A37 N6-methylase TrmN6
LDGVPGGRDRPSRQRHAGAAGGAIRDGIGALAGAGFGSPALLPLWPRAGVAAKRVLLAARRGGRAPGRVLPGLVLHAETGATPAAESVLRDAAALPV